MVGVTLTTLPVHQWNCENNKKQYNLCEVCFKPFNLANIDMHLEAGCAAEIYTRYNITPVEQTKDGKKIKKIKTKTSKATKRSNASRKKDQKLQ